MAPRDLAALAVAYLQYRDASNESKKGRDRLRDQLLPLLEDAGGSYIDEVAGVRLVIEEEPRWDYDPTILHECVKPKILDKEFADCLKTVVDKSVVRDWIDRGMIRERDVTPAKKVTQVISKLQVEKLGGRR